MTEVNVLQAIVLQEFGGPEVLRLMEIPDPEPGPEDILVRVAATAVNRADLLERQGLYPPPGPAPAWQIPGLECAGTVERVGERVTRFAPGDRVMALLTGGGYAQKVAVAEQMAWMVPPSLDLVAAGGIPEVFLTAYDALFDKAGLTAGQRVVIHAGAGGVGSAALQLAAVAGLRVLTTVGSPAKAEAVRQWGPERIVRYREESWVAAAAQWTDGAGVDAVIDFIGADALGDNVSALAAGGVLVVVGTLSGATAPLNLGELLRRRLTVRGTVLRSRPVEDKMRLVRQFSARMAPGFASGRLKPVIDRVYPLEQAGAAHRYLATGHNIGKVLLTC